MTATEVKTMFAETNRDEALARIAIILVDTIGMPFEHAVLSAPALLDAYKREITGGSCDLRAFVETWVDAEVDVEELLCAC